MENTIKQKTLFGYISYSMIYLFYYGAMAAFGSMISLYLAGNEKSTSEIAFIVSAASIFTMILQPLIGVVFDHARREWLVSVLLLVLSGLSGFLFALTQNTVLLFLLNGFSMAFLNSINPVCERLATRSPFRYGVIRLWGAVGYAAGSQISGVIFEHSLPVFNYILFVVFIAFTAIGFYTSRDKIRPQQAEERKKPGVLAGSAELFHDPAFLLFLLFCLLFSGTTTANNTYLPLLLGELLEGSTLVGTVLFVSTMMEIPVIFMSNRFMDRFSGKTLLVMNTGILLIEYTCYAFSRSTVLVCTVIILCKSVATMLFIMVSLKVVLDITENRNSTTALSVIATAKALGGVGMNWLVGFLANEGGIRIVFLTLTIVVVILFLFLLILRLPKKSRNYFSTELSKG